MTTDHQVSVEEVLTHLAQPVSELICCQHKRGGVTKELYCVYTITTGAWHFTVNGKRYDVLGDAVEAYNSVKP